MAEEVRTCCNAYKNQRPRLLSDFTRSFNYEQRLEAMVEVHCAVKDVPFMTRLSDIVGLPILMKSYNSSPNGHTGRRRRI